MPVAVASVPTAVPLEPVVLAPLPIATALLLLALAAPTVTESLPEALP